jgi:hypothetical protein
MDNALCEFQRVGRLDRVSPCLGDRSAPLPRFLVPPVREADLGASLVEDRSPICAKDPCEPVFDDAERPGYLVRGYPSGQLSEFP